MKADMVNPRGSKTRQRESTGSISHSFSGKDEIALTLFETRMGMVDEVGDISEQYRALNDAFAQAIWRRLEPFVERGELVRLRPELYYSLIIGPTAHLARSWLRGRVSFDLLSAVDDLTDAAWKSLRKSEK